MPSKNLNVPALVFTVSGVRIPEGIGVVKFWDTFFDAVVSANPIGLDNPFTNVLITIPAITEEALRLQITCVNGLIMIKSLFISIYCTDKSFAMAWASL
tara:strand:- start:927 stop:1223 length:297 start_codon:yes stop_codon:yes gene_type:complete